MQKIDITPSVEMLRACFRMEQPFAIRFKGGIHVNVETDEAENGPNLRYVLHRYNRGEKTSALTVDMKPTGRGWNVSIQGTEPLAVEMARGIWQYYKEEDDAAVYLAQVMTVYGGKTGDIVSVER